MIITLKMKKYLKLTKQTKRTMAAISIDSYNQTASVEIAEPLRSAEGGDTKPKVLVIKDEDIDREKVLRVARG